MPTIIRSKYSNRQEARRRQCVSEFQDRILNSKKSSSCLVTRMLGSICTASEFIDSVEIALSAKDSEITGEALILLSQNLKHSRSHPSIGQNREEYELHAQRLIPGLVNFLSSHKHIKGFRKEWKESLKINGAEIQFASIDFEDRVIIEVLNMLSRLGLFASDAIEPITRHALSPLSHPKVSEIAIVALEVIDPKGKTLVKSLRYLDEIDELSKKFISRNHFQPLGERIAAWVIKRRTKPVKRNSRAYFRDHSLFVFGPISSEELRGRVDRTNPEDPDGADASIKGRKQINDCRRHVILSRFQKGFLSGLLVEEGVYDFDIDQLEQLRKTHFGCSQDQSQMDGDGVD